MDCYCDYDPPEFFSSSTPRARRAHKCYECSGAITPGERYERAAGKWDGYFSTFVTCERCYNIRTWVQNNLPCFCWAYGNVIDDAIEAVREAAFGAPAETAGLRFGLGRLLVKLRRHNRAARTGRRWPTPVSLARP